MSAVQSSNERGMGGQIFLLPPALLVETEWKAYFRLGITVRRLVTKSIPQTLS